MKKGIDMPEPVVDFISRDVDGEKMEHLRIDKDGEHTVEVENGND
jgi:hypothetical protein